jgi:tagatose 1,6-diphosphate aldolase
MVSKSAQQIVGGIDLRIGTSQRLIMYAGQVGYGVDEIFRGHRFAARSVRLLFPLALRHHLNPLWITCNPDNFASRRTCELAGGTLMEIVPLPNSDELYLEGEREKCRYRFDLKELLAE